MKMTKLENLTNSFTKLNISYTTHTRHLQQHQPKPQQPSKSVDLDFDTVLQNDNTRKLFSQFLKGFNNSCDSLLTLYLICRCFQNPQRIEDRQRIKQILEKTYNTCFVKNNLTDLNSDLKEKIGQSLKRKTYNESVFNAVKAELKLLLETHYFPQFLASDFYHDNVQLFANMTNKSESKLSDKHSTSVLSLDTAERRDTTPSSLNKTSSSLFAMPTIPQQKKPSATSSSSSSRLLKQSKSSSSSTSSVASISSTSKSAASRLPRCANKSASKSSLTGPEYAAHPIRSNRDKSSTSISSLNLPPNPYHVVTKAIPVSAQDSERQSVMSMDDAV